MVAYDLGVLLVCSYRNSLYFCLNHWNRLVLSTFGPAVRGIRLLHSRLRRLIDTTDSRHKFSARVFVLSLCSFSTELYQFTSYLIFCFVVLTGVEPCRPSSTHWLSWLIFCLRHDVSCVGFVSIKSGNHREMTCKLIYNNWHSSAVYCTRGYIIPYPTAFPYGNGMVLHFYQQQESSTTKTVHKVINKGLKTYV